MQRLYHFTALAWLSRIMKVGITLGEIPAVSFQVKPWHERPQLPNLTTNASPKQQDCWNPPRAIDKARVRLTVEVPDTQLISFDEIRRQNGMEQWWVKSLAPTGEHVAWYFSQIPICVASIIAVDVAVKTPCKNEAYSGDALVTLCTNIDSEFNRCFIYNPKTSELKFKNASTEEVSWLLDGPKFRIANGDYRKIRYQKMRSQK